MEFEEVFGYIGNFGIYQLCLYICLGLVAFLSAQQSISAVFVTYNQEHWCKVPSLASYPFEHQKYVSIPYSDGGYDKCTMYDLPYSNYTHQQIVDWNSSLVQPDVVSCQHGWVYDQSVMVATINSEWDLVCDDQYKTSLVSTIYMAGVLVSSLVCGFISDFFGRKVVMVSGVLLMFAMAISSPYANSYTGFVVMRFFTALGANSAYLCAFVAVTEVIGPRFRVAAGVGFQMFWSVGVMVVSGVAYAVRDKIDLQTAIAGPIIAAWIGYLLAPESPRWLVANGHYKKANKIIQEIAVINGRPPPPDIDWSTQSQPQQEEKPKTDEGHRKEKVRDVFCSRVLLPELLLMWLMWFSSSLVYYGLTFSTGTYGNVFLNTFVSGLIEIPANLICMLCLEKAGRRWSNAVALLVCGVACFVCVPLVIYNEGTRLDPAILTFSTIGKAASTFAFSGIYVYTAELFPTFFRNIAIGTSSTAARIASMIAPFMGQPMIDVWEPMPSVVYGVVTLITGLLAMFLPETRFRKMPDTVAEAEAIRKQKPISPKTKDTPSEPTHFENTYQNNDVTMTKEPHVTADVITIGSGKTNDSFVKDDGLMTAGVYNQLYDSIDYSGIHSQLDESTTRL